MRAGGRQREVDRQRKGRPRIPREACGCRTAAELVGGAGSGHGHGHGHGGAWRT